MEIILMTFINHTFGNLSNFNKWYKHTCNIFLYAVRNIESIDEDCINSIEWVDNRLVIKTVSEDALVSEMSLNRITKLMYDISISYGN